MARIARVRIVDDFIKMANIEYPCDYIEETKQFAEKYQGKDVNVIKSGGEWFVVEDNNVVVPISCIAEWYPTPIYLIQKSQSK